MSQNDKSSENVSPEYSKLVEKYRTESTEIPGAQLTETILQMAAKNANRDEFDSNTMPSERTKSRSFTWISSAAVVVLSATLIVMMKPEYEDPFVRELATPAFPPVEKTTQSIGVAEETAGNIQQHVKPSSKKTVVAEQRRSVSSLADSIGEEADVSSDLEEQVSSQPLAIHREMPVPEAESADIQHSVEEPATSFSMAPMKKKIEKKERLNSEVVEIVGLVQFFSIDGGFCGIKTEDEKLYRIDNIGKNCPEWLDKKMSVKGTILKTDKRTDKFTVIHIRVTEGL